MIRITGFLVGVLLTVTAFLLVLDTREPRQPVTQVQATGTGTPLGSAGLSVADGAPGDDAVGSETDVPAVEVPPAGDPGSADTETGIDPEPGDRSQSSGLDLDLRSWNQSRAAFDTVAREPSREVIRYQFWSPFNSQWAAQGFAGRLTSATGVPVEVVVAGPGRYRVAFNYQDETQRLARVKRIETVTGLELE
jgi:hypothetical protein